MTKLSGWFRYWLVKLFTVHNFVFIANIASEVSRLP